MSSDCIKACLICLSKKKKKSLLDLFLDFFVFLFFYRKNLIRTLQNNKESAKKNETSGYISR
uniref:Uncharacterized protein n=1 Tax=Nelumbo nucifera TaxID=4432 RepID=A0A822Y4K1_NELNU|nr:TPA_asm: hypothetical protein HUJ06_028835 [Nelumbo nucifera]